LLESSFEVSLAGEVKRRETTGDAVIGWNDPETLWLNVTNLALGIATLVCLGAAVWGVARELVPRRHRPTWRPSGEPDAVHHPIA
jgi:hypothetical protein